MTHHQPLNKPLKRSLNKPLTKALTKLVVLWWPGGQWADPGRVKTCSRRWSGDLRGWHDSDPWSGVSTRVELVTKELKRCSKTSWCNIKKQRCGLHGQELDWINIEPILGVLSSINGFVSWMARILIPHPKKLSHVFDLLPAAALSLAAI